MVQSAPPDGATGPSRRPPEANGLTLRQSADAAAQRLADAGHTVELHPLVSNERGAPVLAAYASAFMIASLAALAAPLQSSALLAALLGCGLFDLEGRRSWFRGIVPREGARALLQWTRPGPSDGPVVIVAIPDEATRVRQTGVGPLVLAGLGIAALAGALARPFFADPAGPFLVSVALASALVMLIALAVDRRGRVLADEGSGFRLAERIAAALEDSPPERGRVVLATVGGGGLFHDGIEVLLRNQADRLERATTRVLTWQPDSGPLTIVPRDGHLLRSAAPGRFIESLGELGLPTGRGVTAAARARASGWAAIGLQGGLEEPAAVVHTVADAARRLAASR